MRSRVGSSLVSGHRPSRDCSTWAYVGFIVVQYRASVGRPVAAQGHIRAVMSGVWAMMFLNGGTTEEPHESTDRRLGHAPLGKWVVLVLSLLVIGTMGFLRVQAHERPEQRDQLVAPGRRRVHPGHRRGARPSPTPTPSPPSSCTSASPASRRRTRRRRPPTPRDSPNLDKVSGDIIGPIPSKDGEALQTVVTFSIGSDGWEILPGIRRRARADGRGGTGGLDVQHRRAGSGRRRPDGGVLGNRRNLAAGRLGHRLRDPAAHLPQPPALRCCSCCAASARSSRRRESSTSWRSTPTSRSTTRAPASSACSSSAPASTTPCCWWPATARSCTTSRTGTRRWPTPCTEPHRRSWPAAPRSSSGCCA